MQEITWLVGKLLKNDFTVWHLLVGSSNAIFIFTVFCYVRRNKGLKTTSDVEWFTTVGTTVCLSFAVWQTEVMFHLCHHLFIKVGVRQQFMTSTFPLCRKKSVCYCPSFLVQLTCFHKTFGFWKQLRNQPEKKNILYTHTKENILI